MAKPKEKGESKKKKQDKKQHGKEDKEKPGKPEKPERGDKPEKSGGKAKKESKKTEMHTPRDGKGPPTGATPKEVIRQIPKLSISTRSPFPSSRTELRKKPKDVKKKQPRKAREGDEQMLKKVVELFLKMMEEAKEMYVQKAKPPKKSKVEKPATGPESKPAPQSQSAAQPPKPAAQKTPEPEKKALYEDLKAKSPSLESRESVLMIQESIKEDIKGEVISPDDLNDIAVIFDDYIETENIEVTETQKEKADESGGNEREETTSSSAEKAAPKATDHEEKKKADAEEKLPKTEQAKEAKEETSEASDEEEEGSRRKQEADGKNLDKASKIPKAVPRPADTKQVCTVAGKGARTSPPQPKTTPKPKAGPETPKVAPETPEQREERLLKIASNYWESKDREQLAKDTLRLFEAAKNLFKAESRCVKVASPCYIYGDIHGNLYDLMQYGQIFFNKNDITKFSFLFLGDYVDRGYYSLECVYYLFCQKILNPKNFFMVRGNHEERSVQKDHTYYKECVSKFGEKLGKRVWEACNRVFDHLPLCAIVDGTIFCCHGGIPKSAITIEHINAIPVSLNDPLNQSDAAWEIMWSDPASQREFDQRAKESQGDQEDIEKGYVENDTRGAGFYFSELAIKNFFSVNGLTHLIRGHEVFQDGFNVHLGGKVTTVFSSSDYSDDNSAAVVYVTEDEITILIVDTSLTTKEKATRAAQTIRRVQTKAEDKSTSAKN